MTVIEKISLASAILNGLVLAVMAATMLIQVRSLRASQRDTLLALKGVQSQSAATMINYFQSQLARVDPQSGLDAQKEKKSLEKDLNHQINNLNDLIHSIQQLEKRK